MLVRVVTNLGNLDYKGIDDVKCDVASSSFILVSGNNSIIVPRETIRIIQTSLEPVLTYEDVSEEDLVNES